MVVERKGKLVCSPGWEESKPILTQEQPQLTFNTSHLFWLPDKMALPVPIIQASIASAEAALCPASLGRLKPHLRSHYRAVHLSKAQMTQCQHKIICYSCQGLTKYPRLDSNPPSSCLSFFSLNGEHSRSRLVQQ